MHDEDVLIGVLPWSMEAESSVLSALLMDNQAWDRVADILTPADFYRGEHRVIFSAVASLVNANKPADVVTVFDYLQGIGEAESAGGLMYINELGQYASSASNIRRYAEIVAEKSTIRRLLAASDRAREIAVETGLSIADRLDRCQNEFQALSVRRGGQEPQIVGQIAVSVADQINDLHSGDVQPGIATRIPTFDRLLSGGLRAGKQVVIAARPSVGKSVLATSIARACAEQGHPAAVLSMEMGKDEQVQRLIADLGNVNLERVQSGKLFDGEWAGLSLAMDKLQTMPLFIDDQTGLTLGDVQAKARRLVREQGIKLLVVDYMQLMSPSDAKANRHHQIEAISRGLKVLAKQLGLTTIVLSQLNRDVDKRTDRRATLADLKESGSIEEDADVVVLLSNDRTREDGTQVIHADVAKNRGGPKGHFKLALTGRHQRIVETIDAPETRFTSREPREPVYAEDY